MKKLRIIFSILTIIIVVTSLLFNKFNTKDTEKDNKVIKQTKEESLLITSGYTNDEIKFIKEHLSDDEILILTNHKYVKNLKDYLEYKIFKIENLDRYISYRNLNSNLDFYDIIIRVNLNLDKNFYETVKEIDNPNDILALVNKYNKIPDDYSPNDLVKMKSKYAVKELYVRNVVNTEFERLCNDAQSLNLNIEAISAYRTKEYQSNLYNNYALDSGYDEADKFSARSRHSEHELGLAIDVQNGITNYLNFKFTNEYQWLKNSAHNYGFIIRYTSDKETITGYVSEEWHIRYVGEEVAKYIFDNYITFDEYYALFLDEK